jgi:serine/threonine-protein kinase
MGTVFEGENVRIKRKVAIKVLHEHVATSPEFAQRFVREARASARIGSEHVCDVLDLGDLESGEKYIVMELLDGESLEARLARAKQIAPKELVPIVFQILEGLGAMHQVGVIHRDLKPANVFLCNKKGGGGDVTVKILDFGVAKVEAGEEDPSGIHDMTSTGTMMGTPLYMSPEQARGARDVDGRTDLYAASVIFYQGLTGETPHTGVSLHELLFKIVLDDPKPIQSLAPNVDDELNAIVMRGLARDPEQRYSSARAFQEALRAWGAKHDLDFKITLPDEPPLLRRQTGGFPAAVIESAGQAMRTGNTPLSTRGKEGPPTPLDAKAPSSSTIKAGEVAKAGDTLVAGMEPPAKKASDAKIEVTKIEAAKAASTPAKPLPSAAPAAPPVSSRATILIGAVVAVVAAIIGVKLGSAHSSAPPPPPPSGVVPSSAPPPPSVPVPVSVPASMSAAPEPVPVMAEPEAGASARPAPMVLPAPKPSAAPPPTASVLGRTIRVDAGF